MYSYHVDANGSPLRVQYLMDAHSSSRLRGDAGGGGGGGGRGEEGGDGGGAFELPDKQTDPEGWSYT